MADVVKPYARAAGLYPSAFSGHSLRCGFVRPAAECGARAERIMLGDRADSWRSSAVSGSAETG